MNESQCCKALAFMFSRKSRSDDIYMHKGPLRSIAEYIPQNHSITQACGLLYCPDPKLKSGCKLLALLVVLLLLMPLFEQLLRPGAHRFQWSPVMLALALWATLWVEYFFRTRMLITVDEAKLRINLKTIPLKMIVSCRPLLNGLEPESLPGWGADYILRGADQKVVLLMLAEGTYYIFSAQDPLSVCAALCEYRPELRRLA